MSDASVAFDRRAFRRCPEDYVEGVKNYFRDRSEDLMTMDICGGDGWEQLCPFVGKEMLDEPFSKASVGVNQFFKRESRRWFWKGVAALRLGMRCREIDQTNCQQPGPPRSGDCCS